MSQFPPQDPTGQGPLPPPPPPTLGYATPPQGPPGINLRQVAVQQRAIMYCILGEIVIAILRIVLNMNGAPTLGLVVGLLYLPIAIAAAVFIFMLAMSLYNQGTGIVLGILTLIPCIGLITLLIVNGKATTILRSHGIKVGLMGADPSKIPGA